MRITSTRNPLIGYLRSLERAQVRREEGVYLVEGVRLVREALDSAQCASLVLYDPDSLSRTAAGSELLAAVPAWAERVVEADGRILAAAGQTETPAGIIAVLRTPEPPPFEETASGPFGVILDRLGDPGNAGTILRTADALAVDYVITTPGTVDLYSPKVVRAGMGAHFRLALYPHLSWPTIRPALSSVALVATVAREGISVFRFSWPERSALIIGSESHGLSDEAQAAADLRVHLPMRPGVESLNAAIAASVAMYLALGPRWPEKRSVTDSSDRRS